MILPLEWTIKTCFIAAIAFATSLSLRRFSAATRHLVWSAAFCAILFLPLCSSLIPSSLHSDLPAPITRVLAPSAQHYSGSTGSADASALRAPFLPAAVVALSWLDLLWLAGCFASAVILLIGSIRLVRTAHQSIQFFDNRWALASSELTSAFRLKRPVRLLQSREASMPVTWGLFRPRVLVPANAQNWSDKQIRAVLSHEFAHIRRRDWGIQMLAEIARAVYWFNPLLWIACNRLRQEGEHACDDEVLLLGVDGTEYAANIFDVARMLKASRSGWSPTVTMARPSNLERRFAAMVNPSLDRRSVTRGTFLVASLSILFLVLPLAAVRAQIVPAPVSFSGHVYDAGGVAIPNATVILTRVDDATQRLAATSNRTGAFEFSKLAAGHYRVDISCKGFADLHIDDVEIDRVQSAPLNAMLPAETSAAASAAVSEPRRPRPGQRASGPSHMDQEYRIGAIKVVGATVFNDAQIKLSLGLVSGQVYNEDELRRGFESLKTLYGNRGYVDFVPQPVVDFDEQHKLVNLTINIDENRQFTVNRINFTGNTKIRDELIRREILIKEGQVFNAALWDQSLARLNQLGYFDDIKYEDVEIKPSETEPMLDINLKVREKDGK
jgi:beta-lactamase regulating signal transducer with metallopeptidase domain